MPTIIPFAGKTPVIHPSVYLAEGVRVSGDTEIGADSSLWFNAVARGDVHYIRIGERTNIQDNSTLHVTTKTHPCIIGSDVTVGHRAILHGCTVHDHVLIGMGSIVMDGAVVHSWALVAAGALVPPGMVVPEGMLVAGVPAKVIRPLTQKERDGIVFSGGHYCDIVKGYRTGKFDF